MRKNEWKERAWRAVSTMAMAEKCKTVEDMRKVLLSARMDLEAYFVAERNKADKDAHSMHIDADSEEDGM